MDRKHNLKSLVLIALFSLTTFALNDPSGDGPGNGGDPYATEFVARGYYVLAKLRRIEPPLLSQDEIGALEIALKETRIELVERVQPDPAGGLVMATVHEDPLNPGKKVIKLSRDEWKDVLSKHVSVDRVVFHEYLRVIGKGEADKNYAISSQIERYTLQTLVLTQIDEVIQGEFVPASRPFGKHSNKTWGEWYRISGREQIDEDKSLLKQAQSSHQKACTDWKERARLMLGDRIRILICGSRRDNRVARVETFGSLSTYAGYDGDFIGFRSFSVGTIVIAESEKVEKFAEKVASELFYFKPTNLSEVTEAIQKETESFLRACEESTAEAKKDLGSKLLYASCTNSSYNPFDEAVFYDKSEVPSKIRKSSQNIFYFLK